MTTVAMHAAARGARTPEDLETLLEDACIARDSDAVVELFRTAGVLSRAGSRLASGHHEIRAATEAMWRGDSIYVADRDRVLQAADVALSVGRSLNVMCRDADGWWRFAIALLNVDQDGMEQT